MLDKKSEASRYQSFFVTPDLLVPQDYLLRKIDDFMDWSFIYDLVGDLYSPDKGRPSVDPVILFKTLFIQFLYGIKSLQRTLKEIESNNAYRWFLCLGPFEKPPTILLSLKTTAVNLKEKASSVKYLTISCNCLWRKG